MRKMFITLLLATGAISACTVEDIAENVTDNSNAKDGTSQGTSNLDEKKYDYVISPKSVTGDFRTFFQNIVNKHSNVLIKDGTYEIELVNGDGVRPQDGCTITFEENAKIKVKPNSLDVYCLIDLRGRKNITLNNPNLEGDKDKHLTSTGEWCYGINVAECSNIIINNAKISKFWGDGISIRNCSNIKIYKPIIDNNRRQGISITSCENVEIHDPIISNTTGTYPAFGIDVEPNFNGEHVTGLKIFNATFRNNGTKEGSEYPAGFCLSTHMSGKALLPGNKELIPTYFDIELINPTFHGDALMVSTPSDFTYGKITVKNPTFHNAEETALYFFNHQSKNFYTEIVDPVIVNAVQKEKVSIYYTPVLFYCEPLRTSKTTGSQNITIKNPKIIANENAKYKTNAIRNISESKFSEDMKNVKIENLSIIGYKSPFLNHSGDSSNDINKRLNHFSNLHESFTLTVNHQDSQLSSLVTGNEITKTLEGTIVDIKENTHPLVYLTDNIPTSSFEFYYTNNSKDKSTLKLLFGTKNNPTKAYISRWSTERFTGIEVPYGSYIKMKKRIDSQGQQHWTVTEASNGVKGIN